MSQQFMVGLRMLSARTGEMFSSAPVPPLRIAADSAVGALEEFAQRSEGTILETSQKEPACVSAKVRVDGRVFRVRVSDLH
jgi:hypothetical protein